MKMETGKKTTQQRKQARSAAAAVSGWVSFFFSYGWHVCSRVLFCRFEDQWAWSSMTPAVSFFLSESSSVVGPITHPKKY